MSLHERDIDWVTWVWYAIRGGVTLAVGLVTLWGARWLQDLLFSAGTAESLIALWVAWKAIDYIGVVLEVD